MTMPRQTGPFARSGAPMLWRRLFEFAATAAVGAALLALTLHFVDIAQVREGLRKIGYAAAVLAGLLALAQVVLCAVRWSLITRLTPQPLRLRDAMLGYCEAAFVNAFLPTLIVSDGARIMRAINGGTAPTYAFVGVATDRLVALCALAIASASGLFFLPAAIDKPYLLAAIVGPLPAFVVGLLVLDRLGGWFGRYARFWFVRPFLELAAHMKRLWRSPATAALVLAISLVGQAFCTGAFLVLARQLDIDVGFWAMFAISAPILVYAAVPISVGGWGVREAVSAALFGLIGVTPASAVALSIAFGLLMSAVGLFCGALAAFVLIRRRMHKREAAAP
jgi:uncharacterized membrane protein YbhN (UPF0104 family)